MTAWESIIQAPRRLGEAATQARPKLRGIASPPRRMGPVAFAVTLVCVVVAGMVGLLALTTALQNQAFEVRAAQRTANELGYRVSDLASRVNRASAPAELGRRATELGMVPNPNAVFIDVTTGTITGDPVPVRGDEMPSLKVRAVTPPAEKPTAVESGEQPADGVQATDAEAVDPAVGTASGEGGVPQDGALPAEGAEADVAVVDGADAAEGVVR
ncbi:MAG: hypothetical protein IPL36_10260 [Nigerium sp.]|nr:hypothetical protein [Nigerium sp.]